VHRLRLLLPQGHTLPDTAWRQRHHAMVALLVAESIGLTIFSFAEGYSWLHSLAHAAGLLPIAVLAIAIEHRRRAAAVLVSLGLVTACALLVHIWHGKTEGHFLFFVTIVVLALYEDWVPFLVAAAYVIVHHGVMGALDPERRLRPPGRCRASLEVGDDPRRLRHRRGRCERSRVAAERGGQDGGSPVRGAL
jgi:hypothetical protein